MKYGELLEDDEKSQNSSSEESEDEDAELINPNFEKKFLETLTMIRTNDPRLKEIKEELF